MFTKYAKRLIFIQLNFLWVNCDTFLGTKKCFELLTVGRDKKRFFASNEMKITLVSCEDHKRRFISQAVTTLRFQMYPRPSIASRSSSVSGCSIFVKFYVFSRKVRRSADSPLVSFLQRVLRLWKNGIYVR